MPDVSALPFSAVLVGFPTDRNSSFLRGPRKAPPLIRAALFSDAGNPASETGLELGGDVKLVDRGDAPLAEDQGDDALIEAATTAAVQDGSCPIALGGDHSVT